MIRQLGGTPSDNPQQFSVIKENATVIVETFLFFTATRFVREPDSDNARNRQGGKNAAEFHSQLSWRSTFTPPPTLLKLAYHLLHLPSVPRGRGFQYLTSKSSLSFICHWKTSYTWHTDSKAFVISLSIRARWGSLLFAHSLSFLSPVVFDAIYLHYLSCLIGQSMR